MIPTNWMMFRSLSASKAIMSSKTLKSQERESSFSVRWAQIVHTLQVQTMQDSTVMSCIQLVVMSWKLRMIATEKRTLYREVLNVTYSSTWEQLKPNQNTFPLVRPLSSRLTNPKTNPTITNTIIPCTMTITTCRKHKANRISVIAHNTHLIPRTCVELSFQGEVR